MVGIRTGRDKLALILALACAQLFGQTRVSLEQAGARDPNAEFRPRRLNEHVLVRGVVNSPAFHFPDHRLLAIEDGTHGAILRVEGEDQRLDGYRPGDDLEVEGNVAVFAGMPVIQPVRITKAGAKPAPAPAPVDLPDLIGFRYLGRLVRTTAIAVSIGDTANGAYLSVEAPDRFMVFLPRTATQPTVLSGLKPGESVQVTGVAYQYSQRPPFNRYFQLLVQDAAYIVPLPKAWFLPMATLGAAGAGVLILVLLFLVRDRRSRKLRERLRRTYHLGEEILSAVSAGMIVKRLSEALPEVLRVSGLELYVHNRTGRTLDSVPAGDEKTVSFSAAHPAGERSPAVVWCFQYNTALSIPDPSKSPLTVHSEPGRVPKSLLLVPMVAQGDVVGVLQLDRDRAGAFTEADQELAQHLAKHAAVAILLIDQRSVQEQLFRTEKMAAVGRLISGVVDELRLPLESIEDLANQALERHLQPTERELGAIAGEARKASSIVKRLVSYASAEQAVARPVQVGPLLRRLIEFREGDWKASGIRVRDLTTREPLAVLGSEGQLEQVFLTLLVHAEQALAEAPQKLITVRTSVLAKRILVEIAFTSAPVSRKTVETASVLGVTRSVIAGHGGEVRLIEKSNADPRFEIELPISAKERTMPVATAAAASGPRRDLTVLVIDNEESTQRQILACVSARGARVVPIDNADTGLDLAHRMRFDVAFCSVHAPGLNWVELSERLHSVVGAFVLISDRVDPELAIDFEGEGRFVLSKPVQESDVARVLDSLEPPMSAVKNGAA
jgi:CheY-like chemotaxis protein